MKYSKEQIRQLIAKKLEWDFDVKPSDASDNQFYKALASVIVDILEEKRQQFYTHSMSNGRKQVYYLSMEFLMGRSLKNSIYNLGLVEPVRAALKDYGVNLENLYEQEPDAGLGNGGLGRLAACFLDSLATLDYPATGYSICYEFGIFKQKIVDGWQTELPDNWLPGGEVWLKPAPDSAVDVNFGGEVEEFWDSGYHHINHKNYTTVRAVPYNVYVSGYGSQGVSLLRLWKAESPAFDIDSFNKGDYVNALGQNSIAEAISKILYPNDNHTQGKILRLRQQYFMCAASVGDIVKRHMSTYGTLENLHEKVAIHINDTHPTLAIPELMRILLDECGYNWDQAWHIVEHTFAYTNHTVMKEALECWNEDLFRTLLPRIYQIVCEINRRFCDQMMDLTHGDQGKVDYMSIVSNHQVKMANLCVVGSHCVNGVSKLHSQIIKDDVFHDFYEVYPHKFRNVTNGIAYRRWLYQSNPGLTGLLKETIGDGFLKDASHLKEFRNYADDKRVLDRLAQIKKENKQRFADYIKQQTGVTLNTDSVFDVQVKRLHEYKRQHLNALNIIHEYQYLLQHPDADFLPKTYIFGAKAAPGYFLAKQIIKLLCNLSAEIEKNEKIRDKLRIVYLEDYRVTLSELLMPASEISEQISLAGTEASGTGNMKLMLNGAVTLGTLDGANVEIAQEVGDNNIITFGLLTEEVNARKAAGYHPQEIYDHNPDAKAAIDLLFSGINGEKFEDVGNSLRFSDPYLVLADFDSYREAQAKASRLYRDQTAWNRMSLENIAGAGKFSSDRSIQEYAHNIWHL